MDMTTLLASTGAKIGFILVIILTFAPLIIWAERRQSAMIQDRIGPHRAGVKLPPGALAFTNGAFWVLLILIVVTGAMAGAAWCAHWFDFAEGLAELRWSTTVITLALAAAAGGARLTVKARGNITLIGLLHPLADALKFIWKEDFVPPKADKLLHALAPIISLVPAIATFAVVPFADTLYLDSLGDYVGPGGGQGTAIPMQVANLNVGILFALAVAGTGVIGAAIAGYASDNKFALLGGLRAAGQMVSYEVALGLTIVPCFMMYESLRLEEMVRWQYETGVWGIFVPWLTGAFVLFFTASIAETKRIPFDVPEGESELVAGYFTEYSGMKFGMFFMAEFVEVIVLAAFAVTIFFGGWDVPFLHESGFDFARIGIDRVTPLPHWAVVLIQVLSFVVKVTIMIWLQLQIRWTLPRFRYDQIMSLCWKYLLPIALVNILITGAVILLFFEN